MDPKRPRVKSPLSLAEVGGGGWWVLFPYRSHQIGTCMCYPKGYGFHSENGYRLCTLWSGIWYGFRGN